MLAAIPCQPARDYYNDANSFMFESYIERNAKAAFLFVLSSSIGDKTEKLFDKRYVSLHRASIRH